MPSKNQKRQHYVPQFYLRNFSYERAEPFRIYSFDKTRNVVFDTKPKDACLEKFFYGRGKQANDAETDFCSIEGKTSPIIRKVLERDGNVILDCDERDVLSRFISGLYGRTKETRELITDLGRNMEEMLSGERLSADFAKAFEEWKRTWRVERTQVELLRELDVEEDIHGWIAVRVWTFLVNETDIPFWTSDHPVVRNNSLLDDLLGAEWGKTGWKNIGVEIYLPLNPRICLAIFDPRCESACLPHRKIVNSEEVKYTNSLQVRDSTRFIFSNKNEFSIAKDMLGHNPELGQVDRKRIVLHYR